MSTIAVQEATLAVSPLTNPFLSFSPYFNDD
jgi:hypothetical protein